MDEYSTLRQVFDDAVNQAQNGKGKERHARKNQKFEDQVMCEVQRLLIDHPFGALAYQVIKKTIEAGRLYNTKGIDEALYELSGAMNYLGGLSIVIKEQKEER